MPAEVDSEAFSIDDEDLTPELRAQRTLSKSRVPEISRYIRGNPKDYIFSALTASIDGIVTFKPIGTEGDARQIGNMHVDMNARFLINDGQHRCAAIEQAMKEEPDLSTETIAVVFFMDRGLERSQQMFADLNRHAIRPSRSLGLLYDHRNDLSKIAKLVALKSEAFRGLVEMERSTLAERSRKLFTLSSIYSACTAFLGDGTFESEANASSRCIEYWDAVADHVPEWALVKQSKMTAEKFDATSFTLMPSSFKPWDKLAIS